MSIRLLRLPEVMSRTGKSKSQTYDEIKRGLFPAPVANSARCSAWPDSEVDSINAARIAGKTEDEIRALVRKLVAARKTAA